MMRRILLTLLLMISISTAQYHFLFVFFQKGFYDTAYVDTMDICDSCSARYNLNLCTLTVRTSLLPDTSDSDIYWHEYLPKFWIFDSSLGTAETFYINDTNLCHCYYSGIPYCYFFPVAPCWSPVCTTVWGYHFWYIPISYLPHFSYISDGDSVCFRFQAGSYDSYNHCYRYDSSVPIQYIRIILVDTTLIGIYNNKKKPKYKTPRIKGIYDIMGRKVSKIDKTGIYIIDGKKKVIIK